MRPVAFVLARSAVAALALTSCSLSLDESRLASDGRGCPVRVPEARTVTLPDGLGCDGELGACVAAVPPFVFVGTRSMVLAVAMGSRAEPRVVAELPGLVGELATRELTTSGRRLYVAGGGRFSADAANPMRGQFPLGWLDVPSDAGAALAARQEIVDAPDMSDWFVVPTVRDGLLVVSPSAGAAASAAALDVPLRDRTAVYVPTQQAAGEFVAGASGERLVVRTIGPPGFRLVSAAGTPRSAVASPQRLPEPVLASAAPAETFGGRAEDGAFAALFAPADASSQQTATLLGLMYDDDLDFLLNTTKVVALETYPAGVPLEAPRLKPSQRRLAFASRARVWALARAAEGLDATSATLVDVAAAAPAAVPGSRRVLASDVSRHALVTSGDVVYLVSRTSSTTVAIAPLVPPDCR